MFEGSDRGKNRAVPSLYPSNPTHSINQFHTLPFKLSPPLRAPVVGSELGGRAGGKE